VTTKPNNEVDNGGVGQRPLPATLKALLGSQRTVAFRRSLAEICDGDQVAALFLAQCLYWSERTADSDRWFYKSQKDWYEELALTRHQLDRIRGILKRKAFLIEHLKHRAPAVLEYQLNLDAIEEALRGVVGNKRTSMPQTGNLLERQSTRQIAVEQIPSLPQARKPYKEAKSSSNTSQESTQGSPIALAKEQARKHDTQTAVPLPRNGEAFGVAEMWRTFKEIVDQKKMN
jgi:hypothetical protein